MLIIHLIFFQLCHDSKFVTFCIFSFSFFLLQLNFLLALRFYFHHFVIYKMRRVVIFFDQLFYNQICFLYDFPLPLTVERRLVGEAIWLLLEIVKPRLSLILYNSTCQCCTILCWYFIKEVYLYQQVDRYEQHKFEPCLEEYALIGPLKLFDLCPALLFLDFFLFNLIFFVFEIFLLLFLQFLFDHIIMG